MTAHPGVRRRHVDLLRVASDLVSRRRRVQGWPLARDLLISGVSVLFAMWVTFAAGYAAVYQAMVIVLIGVILYAFIKSHRERTGQVPAPLPGPGTGQVPAPLPGPGTGQVPAPRPSTETGGAS